MRFVRLLFTLALVCATGVSEAMNLGVRTAMISAATRKVVVDPEPTLKTFSFVNGQFNVTKVYDGNSHTIDTGAITNALSTLDVQVSVSYTGEPLTNVGSNTISYKFSAEGYRDYVGSSTVVITPKPITVTANNQEMYVGDEEPELSFEVDGLIAGDTLVGALAVSHDSQVGTYSITQGTLTNENNANYSITFVEGTLTIKDKTPPPPPIYCPELPELKESYGEFALGVTIDPIDFDFAAGWKVAGLPAGLKFALDKTTKKYSVTGKPTKSGTFTVTLTKTVNKQKTVVTTTFYVMSKEKDLAAIEIKIGEDMTPEPEVDSFADITLPVGVKVDWPIELVHEFGSTLTVKVAGLPAGLKLVQDKTTKAYSIQGVPTSASKIDKKTGKVVPSLVKFTVTTAGKNSRIYMMSITTTAIPNWAVGTFNGGYVDGVGNPCGLSTVTITAAGKISGKILTGGKTWTLVATSFDSYDVDEESKPYYSATVSAKCGKETASLIVFATPSGVFGSGIDAYQNLWKTEWKGLGKTLAANPEIKKNGLPLPSEFKLPWALMTSLQLKFAASGTVSATANFELKDSKGKPITYKSTCSTVLIPFDGGGYALYLYFAPNDKKGFTGRNLLFIYPSL